MSRQRGKSIEEVLALLSDPDFVRDVKQFIGEAAALRQQALSLDEWTRRAPEIAQGFRERWGVWPPHTLEVLDADPRRRIVDALASGRWGILSVFAWTTDIEVGRLVKGIRRVVGKRHTDSLGTREIQLVRWLEDCGHGFQRPEIARAVFGRDKGLRRRTAAEAIRTTPEETERALYARYKKLGFGDHEIERRVMRRLRGSEPPATAAIRMAGSRYERQLEDLNTKLVAPVGSEPLSQALTPLFRELPDLDAVPLRRRVRAVVEAFETVRSRETKSRRTKAPQWAERTDASSWGIVPVFTWTTYPEIRVSVRRIRQGIRDHKAASQAPAGVLTAGRSSATAALARLLAGACQDDDVMLNHLAIALRDSFVRLNAP